MIESIALVSVMIIPIMIIALIAISVAIVVILARKKFVKSGNSNTKRNYGEEEPGNNKKWV